MKKPNLSLLKNKIKQKKEKTIILLLSVFISFLFVSIITQASTTIGNNINTEGTLIVQGRINASSTLQTTGATRFYSTARIDGATILNSVSYTWPSSDGSASTYLQTNGAGTLSWATVSSGASSDWLKQTNFGVLNLTASTTIPYWAKDAIYASSTLQVQGLTTLANASTTQTSVSSNFYTGLTANSIPFIGANGLLTQNTSNLIWDNTNTRLGIGTTTPNWLLQAAGTRPFLTLSDTGAAANNKHWFLSSQGGNFYLGTSSDAYATTSISALTITNGGNVGIGVQPSAFMHIVQPNITGVNPNVLTVVGGTSTDYPGGGGISLTAGNGVGGGGVVTLTSGAGSSGSLGASFILSGASNNGIGGSASVTAGNSGGGASGGAITLTGGVGTGEGTGGTITISGGNYSPGHGGDVSINGGAKTGSGIDGDVLLSSTRGMVGIGTTTPNWLLQAAGARPFFTLSDTGAATNNKHWFLSSQGGNFYVGTSSDAYATSTSNLLNLISSNYSVGIGTTSPTEQLSVSGRLFVGGTGTSTIQNNLYVMGTLRSTVSYVGDLIFSNNFKFIETSQDAKIQSLFLQNQYGENLFKIDENGKVVVKEIEAEKVQSKKIRTDELKIGSPQNRTGITIYDRKTGEPVCVFSENNVLKSSKGECK